MWGIDGECLKWNEVLKDISNGKLRNRRCELEGDDYKDLKSHDISKCNGYKSITTNPEIELSLDGRRDQKWWHKYKKLKTERWSYTRRSIPPDGHRGKLLHKKFSGIKLKLIKCFRRTSIEEEKATNYREDAATSNMDLKYSTRGASKQWIRKRAIMERCQV